MSLFQSKPHWRWGGCQRLPPGSSLGDSAGPGFLSNPGPASRVTLQRPGVWRVPPSLSQESFQATKASPRLRRGHATRATGQAYSEPTLAKCDLREALASLDKGLVPLQRAAADKVHKSIHALAALQEEKVTTSHELLSATWRMLWTTEKETLFILKWAPLLGTRAGGVFQPINVNTGVLSNIITFPPSGSFVVNSSIEVLGKQRVGFKFNKANLKIPGRSLSLPPYGQGWFDNVFLDEDLRISRDSRGDTLVTERAKDEDVPS